jgi:hypothetical protein
LQFLAVTIFRVIHLGSIRQSGARCAALEDKPGAENEDEKIIRTATHGVRCK